MRLNLHNHSHLMKKILPISCILALLTPIVASAFPYTVTDKSYDINFETTFSRILESNFKSPTAGDVKVDRWKSEVAYKHAWMKGFFEVGTFYEHSSYKASQQIAPGFNVGSTHDWGMDFAVLQHIDGPWSAFARYGFNSAKQKDASFEKSFLHNAMLGGVYKFTDSFNLSFGLFYDRNFERTDIVLPFLGIDWKISENLRLRTANGVYLDFDFFADGKSVFLTKIEYNRRQYRMDGNSASSMEDRYWELGFAFQHYVYEGFYVRPHVNVLFARELVQRIQNNKAHETNVGTGVELGLTGGFDF